MMNPLPTIEQAFSMLSQEESHRSLSPVAAPASMFYSMQNRTADRKKEVKCDRCNWTGDNCFRLIGYPPGHKLYKQQGKGYNKKCNKDFQKNKKTSREVNLVEDGSVEAPQPETSSGAQVFTPAQYAEILKLLGNSGVQSSTQPVVNTAGNILHCVSHDWILDTGANEHMFGNSSLLRN